MTRRICILICLILAGLTAPRAVWAEKRIAILDFEGASSPHLRDTVAALIRARHQVISEAKYQRAADKLGVKGNDDEDVAKVAKAIEADGVLTGELSEQPDRRYLLILRLRAGSSGEPVKRFKLWLKSPRLSSRIKSQLSARLLAAIDGLPLIEHATPRERDPDEPRRFEETLQVEGDEPADDADETLEVEDEGGASTSDSGASSNSGSGTGTSVGRTVGTGDHRDWRAYPHASAASVQVGASLVTRTLTFTTTPPDFAQAPQGYDGPLAPGVYASGEIYPLAFLPRPKKIMTMIGVGFEVDRVLGLKTAIAGGAMDTLAPTTQMRYSVDVHARYNIAGNNSLPTIKLGFGIGGLSFDVDRSDLPIGVMLDVPNTAYSYLEPSILVHVPVMDRVALSAGGRIMIITDTGEVQEQEQYGAALVQGLSAGLGLDVLATRDVLIRLSGTYTAVDFEFRGTGVQTNNRDGDDTTQDVDGAHDRYLTFVLSAGYLF